MYLTTIAWKVSRQTTGNQAAPVRDNPTSVFTDSQLSLLFLLKENDEVLERILTDQLECT